MTTLTDLEAKGYRRCPSCAGLTKSRFCLTCIVDLGFTVAQVPTEVVRASKRKRVHR